MAIKTHEIGVAELNFMSTPLPPEYRRCPVTGRWVVIAPERAARPITLSHAAPHSRDANGRADCPFCEGSEHDTPGERFAIRVSGTAPNGPGWQLRVVPNKYPAVRSHSEPKFASERGSLLESRPAIGQHELVIPCSRHLSNPVDLTDGEFRDMVLAYRDRILTHAANPRTAYVTIFQNVGAEAGASLAHLHSQIVTMPMVPDGVQHELDQSAAYFERVGKCVFCDIVRDELRLRQRVVTESPHFIVLTPFAARFAYEMWVLPKAHVSHFETINPEIALELAVVFKDILGRLDAMLHKPAYNFFLHTSPTRSSAMSHYHWHFEIIPRTARAAGFEWGSGCFINTTSPEQAALELRHGGVTPRFA